ncbi:C-type lectin domain family 2 member L isoform X3 [Taeniopygia guttata]|uniref:C-type lectin domain family 2 member L isoform X3 n=1 Tax=Taeniopygia guttata TaxID=59729 RepID=UPI0013F2AEE9|nr:C-type lectin domain family 2 member F isoform X3 [Taeniopygia guttata]
MAEVPCEEGGDSAAVMELLQQRAEGRTNFSLRCTNDRKVTIAVTVLAVVLLLTVAILTLAAKKHPPCSAPTLPSCLESGIGFGNKCFYFLEEEVDWEGSQHSCLSRQAHLATIDTREELKMRTKTILILLLEVEVFLPKEGIRGISGLVQAALETTDKEVEQVNHYRNILKRVE